MRPVLIIARVVFYSYHREVQHLQGMEACQRVYSAQETQTQENLSTILTCFYNHRVLDFMLSNLSLDKDDELKGSQQ